LSVPERERFASRPITEGGVAGAGSAGHHATAAERGMAAPRAGRYRSRMDALALTIMASALTFSSFVVLLGWR
jgi:hypothetical protein